MRPDGTSVTGPISERTLSAFHIKTAILSATGIALEGGLYEVDIAEAELKRKIMASADSVMALNRFQQVRQSRFDAVCALNQIAHLYTDDALPRPGLSNCSSSRRVHGVCGRQYRGVHPHQHSNSHYRIGFGNLTEDGPFYVDVRRGLERTAHQAGNIDLIVATTG